MFRARRVSVAAGLAGRPGCEGQQNCREQVYKGDDSDTTSYLPVVQYEYQVGNQTYRGSPTKPADAVLQRRGPGNMLGGGPGLCFDAGGLGYSLRGRTVFQ